MWTKEMSNTVIRNVKCVFGYQCVTKVILKRAHIQLNTLNLTTRWRESTARLCRLCMCVRVWKRENGLRTARSQGSETNGALLLDVQQECDIRCVFLLSFRMAFMCVSVYVCVCACFAATAYDRIWTWIGSINDYTNDMRLVGAKWENPNGPVWSAANPTSADEYPIDFRSFWFRCLVLSSGDNEHLHGFKYRPLALRPTFIFRFSSTHAVRIVCCL